MVDAIVELLTKIFGENSPLIPFFASMVPLIELKGAIPVGVKCGLELLPAAGLAYLGSTLVFIPVFFLLIPIFNLLKKIKPIKGLVEKIEAMLDNKAQKVAAKHEGDAEKEKRKFLIIALFCFVAVPFPVTGVFTGTAIAVFLHMKFKDSILPIALGNLVAGLIVTLLTFLFKDYVDIIIYVLFGIAIIMVIITIVKIAKSKPKEAEVSSDEVQ